MVNESLVPKDGIILPLHIKPRLMKQFVIALDKDGNCFNYIFKKLYNLSLEKLEADILDGPQISYMTDIENNA